MTLAAPAEREADIHDAPEGAVPAQMRGSLLFRAVNERIRELEGDRPAGDYDVVCECEDDTCTSVIRMSAEQYGAVRSCGHHFAVLPRHQRAETDVVIGRTDGYVVVAKPTAAGLAAGPGATATPS